MHLVVGVLLIVLALISGLLVFGFVGTEGRPAAAGKAAVSATRRSPRAMVVAGAVSLAALAAGVGALGGTSAAGIVLVIFGLLGGAAGLVCAVVLLVRLAGHRTVRPVGVAVAVLLVASMALLGVGTAVAGPQPASRAAADGPAVAPTVAPAADAASPAGVP